MPYNCLLVKTSPEIFIKSDAVSDQMTKLTIKNIKAALEAKGFSGFLFNANKGRIVVRGPLSKLKKSVAITKTIFGVHSLALAEFDPNTELSNVLDKILSCARETIRSGDSFAIDCSRTGNQAYSSKDIEIKAGALVLDSISRTIVNLEKPKKTVLVRIYSNGFFVFASETFGPNGLPVGCQGTLGFLVGQKKDARTIWLLLKRGCRVVLISNKKSYLSAFKKLEKWNSFQKFSVFLVSELDSLIQRGQLLALATADSVLNEKQLQKNLEFDSQFEIPVLRPLQGIPLNGIKIKI